jgi:23S rRNA (cytosine1962-C5)-methyltransferase
VSVRDCDDQFLCWAAYSPTSKISARIWSWNEEDIIGENFFRKKIETSIQVRQSILEYSNAIRLVYAESDRMPGLIVDRYSDALVVQFLSAGAEYWKDCLVNICSELTGIVDIYERSDVDIRRLEGLEERTGKLRGKIPEERITIHEYGVNFLVDVLRGHKTGFYLDQRENRHKISSFASGKDVLDCFTYTGGFSITALSGGARSITAIDASGEAIKLALENIQINHLSSENVELIEGDVFHELRNMRDRGKSYDLIILDPPKFAPTQASIKHAARGYKDINLLALKLLRPHGHLVTFSCSGAIDADLFQKIIAGAALDAGISAVIIDRLHQANDHPVDLNFPEGAYLKGLILHKMG